MGKQPERVQRIMAKRRFFMRVCFMIWGFGCQTAGARLDRSRASPFAALSCLFELLCSCFVAVVVGSFGGAQ